MIIARDHILIDETLMPADHVTGRATAAPRSRSRLISIVVWTLWAVAFGLVALNESGSDLNATVGNLAAVLQVTSGAILITRLPRNRVGWLLWLSGLLISLALGSGGFATYGLVARPGTIPGAIWLAWISEWIGFPGITIAAAFLPLIYPTGTLLSPRWRIVVVLLLIATVIGIIQKAFGPFAPGDFPAGAQNPLLVSGSVAGAIAALGGAANVASALLVLAAAASIVIRYRRSSGVERQQLKWFTYVAVVVFFAILAAVTTELWFIWLLALGGLALLPVTIGLAVLRYRLYDIDVVIRRTLVYGALVALLAGAYAGSVLLFSALLSTIAARSSLAVAGSTLVVAALFSPVRTRFRSAVDRRFDRSRFDAAQELTGLSGRLRDQVDLDDATTDVMRLISRTLAPVSTSIWLRAAGGSRKGGGAAEPVGGGPHGRGPSRDTRTL